MKKDSMINYFQSEVPPYSSVQQHSERLLDVPFFQGMAFSLEPTPLPLDLPPPGEEEVGTLQLNMHGCWAETTAPFEVDAEDPLMTAQIVETHADLVGLVIEPMPLVSLDLDDDRQDSALLLMKPTNDSSPCFRDFQSEQWAQKFDELGAYKLIHGDCMVPHKYDLNPMLARWVKRQRYQYKLMLDGERSAMTPERALALNEIGFVWDMQFASWMQHLNDLKLYKAVSGHCNVPSHCAEYPKLAAWIKCQRRQYKLQREGRSSHMTNERIHELELIGFQWEIRGTKRSRGDN